MNKSNVSNTSEAETSKIVNDIFLILKKVQKINNKKIEEQNNYCNSKPSFKKKYESPKIKDASNDDKIKYLNPKDELYHAKFDNLDYKNCDEDDDSDNSYISI